MIIENVLGNINEIELKGRKKEKILMDHYDLTKTHQKVKTETGEVFAISLEPGQFLEAGTAIFADDDRVIYIELLPEKCLVVRPKGNVQWARAAFNIGNMHQAAYIQEDCIVVAYDEILESVVHKLGVDCKCEEREISGIRANVSRGESQHHHSHHDHHHHED